MFKVGEQELIKTCFKLAKAGNKIEKKQKQSRVKKVVDDDGYKFLFRLLGI